MIHDLIKVLRKQNAPTVLQATERSAQTASARTLNSAVTPQATKPWHTSPSIPKSHSAQVIPLHSASTRTIKMRISTDPSDARRTVITGRFAEVCAALDRLVLEQEAAA